LDVTPRRRRQRDDFPQPVSRLLAERVGYRCSRQSCRHATVGAGQAATTVIRIGVAAHITAAARGGPRYDESLTPAERSSAENGIWLCQTCSRIIDRDTTRYTARLLQAWKADAERTAELEVTHGAVPDIAADIAALLLNTERTIGSAAVGRTISTPDAGLLHIDRAVVRDVVAALRDGNLLLVSEAGAGKTAVLLDVVEQLHTSNERVVFLDATDRRLLDPRSCFGLNHTLEEVLFRWEEGAQPGFLIIDGLDAMRASASFDTLLRVIRDVRNGPTPWHVLAATRDYDLESALQLRGLFPVDGSAPIRSDLTDNRFSDVAHVVVRGLGDDDFAALAEQSAALSSLLSGATADLRDLLRNPFNLGIAARLAAVGLTVDLSHIRNRVQLLDLWWTARVRARTETGTAAQRESHLRGVCTLMLSRRELRAPLEDFPSDNAAEGLFSDGVLAKLGRYDEYGAFAHAIIFDYAVYRLSLQTGSIAHFLERDRELALFALPSIRLRLADLWERNRANFYDELRDLFVSRQRRTLLMATTRTVVECSRDLQDVEPLLAHTDDAGNMAVRYLVRNLIYLHQRGLPIVGSSAGPWTGLALAMGRQLPDHEHDGLLLLHECLRDASATTEQRVDLAHAARLFLRHQLRPNSHDPVLTGMAISSFIKTYDVAPRRSRPYLDRLLDRQRIERHGRYELQPLAYEVKALHDPEALVAIYSAVFSNISVGEGKIDIGRRSAVMSMVQEASQTLSTARWALGERFPRFLEESPQHAVQALALVLDYEAQHRRQYQTVTVRTGDRNIVLGHDHSNIRDTATYAHDPWYTMIRSFEDRLRSSLSAGDAALFRLTYDSLSADVHGMHMWRVLLLHAGLTDETAAIIAPLVACEGVLLALELGEPVAEYLRLGYPRLTHELRAAIDAALLGIVHDGLEGDYVEYRSRRRAQFARELSLEAIVTPELRAIAEASHAQAASQTLRERELTLSGSTLSGTWAFAPRLSEGARSAGASDALSRSIDAARPLLTFASGQNPPDGTAILPAIDRIETAAVDAPPEARGHALDVICALIRGGLEHKLLTLEDHPRLINLLVQSIAHPNTDPVSVDVERDENEETLSWGSPWRFADGALALGYLLQRGYDPRIVDCLRQLTKHPRANVRNLAILSSRALVAIRPDEAVEFAELGVSDRAIGVVHSGLDIALRLNPSRPEVSRRLTYAAYDCVVERPDGAETTIRSVLNAMVYFSRSGGHDDGSRLADLAREPWRRPHVAVLLAGVLADNLHESRPLDERQHAQPMLLEIITRCEVRIQELLVANGNNVDTYGDGDRRTLEACIRIVRNAAERLYFASGTMERGTPTGLFSDSGHIDAEQFALLQPLLEKLASVPYAGTAYHVVKTLLGAIEAYPSDALRIAALAIRSAAGSIESDHLAEDDMRAFTLRYIREHRGLLSTDLAALSGIMDIVDVFVDAGWPQWIDVFFELDRIYRE